MTITELEQVTREYLRDITKKEFKGRIYIEPLFGSDYYLKRHLIPRFPIFLTSCGKREPIKNIVK